MRSMRAHPPVRQKRVGARGREVKQAISVARRVMENTQVCPCACFLRGLFADVPACVCAHSRPCAERRVRAQHTFLAGESATAFAVQMGFARANLTTNASAAAFRQWQAARCQPNYWQNVVPDHTASCGPFKPLPGAPRAARTRTNVRA